MKTSFKSPLCVFIVILIPLGTFYSCKKEKKVEINELKDVSKEGEELSNKSINDTNYIDSQEYQSDKRQFDIALSKKTSSMNNNDRMLVFFESYLRMLKQFSDKIIKDPSLVNNRKYMDDTQSWASKVREYHDALMKANLSNDQKKRFKYLNDNYKQL
jgi:archaellum component FlaF (FlaF/FlaG flagellin family)